MTVTTYVGFSIIAFMNMLWMLLPFDNGELTWPNHGTGLRNTIPLASSFSGVMNDTLAIRIGSAWRFPQEFFFFPVPVLSGLAFYALQDRHGHERGGSEPHVCQGSRT